MNQELKIEKIDPRHESVNERFWRGEIIVEELIEMLQKVPQDAKVRIYANKFQFIAPNTSKVFTLDIVDN